MPLEAPNKVPLYVDTPENADWTKVHSFDVRIDDGKGGHRLARNVEEIATKMGKTVAEVKTLPVYQGALRHWEQGGGEDGQG